jgi:crotonobetainyl-CoA:carnitine CoA-transferase CaiB-like acyl-CoA transferase
MRLVEAPRREGPLSGIRVLDLSRVVAGPYVGRLLADMGADVIKIEPPEGDQARLISPRFDWGMSALYTFANVGKRGLCVDLKQEAGALLIRELAAAAQLVVENFRPGVLARLGLGVEVLQRANPALVLLSLNGFGSDSAWADRMAYAPILHAVTGILADQAQYAGQPVAQRNDAHADTLSALHGALAALAAIRLAEQTGHGQHVEIPMFDAVLTSYSEVNFALLPEPDDREMNPLYDAGPHGAIAMAGDERWIWARVQAKHGLPQPVPKAADRETKRRKRRAALEAWLAAQPDLESTLARLAEAQIACAPVVSLPDALHGPLAEERALLVDVDDRRGGRRPVVQPAARFSRSENCVRGPAPRRGEHNREVLREVLGWDDARIDALQRAGVLLESGPDER